MLAVTFAHYKNEHLETHRKNLELGIQLGKKISTGVIALSFSAIPQLHIRWQHRTTTLNQTRLAKADLNMNDIRNVAISVGGAFQFGISIPLAGNLSMVSTFNGAIMTLKLSRNDRQNWRVVPSLGGAIGVGYIF